MTVVELELDIYPAERDDPKLCRVANCERLKHKGDTCDPHRRMLAEGLPLVESVWVARRLVNVKRVGDCLIWQGAPNNMGYGKVGVHNDPTAPGSEEAVHRWFYKRFVGPIPAETPVLDHLCRTPLCVNVEHLEPVTQLENDRRGQVARGFGPEREVCANGHPWVPENIRPTNKGVMWERYTCRLCNTENARRKRGHAPRGSRTRAEAQAALKELSHV